MINRSQQKFQKAIAHQDTFPPTGQEAENLATLRVNLADELTKIGETMPEKTRCNPAVWCAWRVSWWPDVMYHPRIR